MTAEPTGRELDRAIAELMGWHVTFHARHNGPCLGHLWRNKPEGGTEWMEVGTPSFPDRAVLPAFTESLDALQAPEKVLRDAGWGLNTDDFGPTQGYLARWQRDREFSVVRIAPTEAAARAAAVYAGLRAWKEASGG